MISEEVFNQLYKKYYLDIFKFAFSYVKRKDLAEDVLQDTFIELYLHSPKSNEKIKSWLFKVAKNKCMDIIRKERKEERKKRERREKGLERHADLDCQTLLSTVCFHWLDIAFRKSSTLNPFSHPVRTPSCAKSMWSLPQTKTYTMVCVTSLTTSMTQSHSSLVTTRHQHAHRQHR